MDSPSRGGRVDRNGAKEETEAREDGPFLIYNKGIRSCCFRDGSVCVKILRCAQDDRQGGAQDDRQRERKDDRRGGTKNERGRAPRRPSLSF